MILSGPAALLLALATSALPDNKHLERLCYMDDSYNKEQDPPDFLDLGAFARGLGQNQGLIKLNISGCRFSSENWHILCDALKGHPRTLKEFSINGGLILGFRNDRITSETEKQAMTRALAASLDDNTVLQHASICSLDREIYKAEIVPLMENNRDPDRYYYYLKKIQEAVEPPRLRCALLGWGATSLALQPTRIKCGCFFPGMPSSLLLLPE
jgi:hypothetical protein